MCHMGFNLMLAIAPSESSRAVTCAHFPAPSPGLGTTEKLKPCLLKENVREGNPCGLPRCAHCPRASILANQGSGFQIRPEEAFRRFVTQQWDTCFLPSFWPPLACLTWRDRHTHTERDVF